MNAEDRGDTPLPPDEVAHLPTETTVEYVYVPHANPNVSRRGCATLDAKPITDTTNECANAILSTETGTNRLLILGRDGYGTLYEQPGEDRPGSFFNYRVSTRGSAYLTHHSVRPEPIDSDGEA